MKNDSAVNLARVFDKLHVHYDAICLFCVSRDSISQLKYPVEGNETLAISQQLRWSKSLRPVVHDLVSPEDHLAVYEFLLPHSMQSALPAPDSQAEIAFRSPNEHWKKLVIQPITFKDGKADEILYLLTDQTKLFNQFEELKALSERDELTYLFNRRRLTQMMEKEYRGMKSCGVLFFDVNNLKPINDQQGHDAGDALLRLVAESLRSVVNREVHAFRYGGDEFIVVAKDCTEEHMDTLVIMCRNRLNTLSRESGIQVSVAVGKAWESAPEDVYDLIRAADKDMYINKRRMKEEIES
ncbi:MAG: GGDEF domain-containing protein [Clostridia bacterium]|nr:GGDEF domain-containing protein [Clostridia bacterium]